MSYFDDLEDYMYETWDFSGNDEKMYDHWIEKAEIAEKRKKKKKRV